MGNAESRTSENASSRPSRDSDPDAGEKEAYNVIRWIPGFGQAYSAIRSAVYAGKGDMKEAEYSGKGMIYGYQQGEALVDGVKNAPSSALQWGKDTAKEAVGNLKKDLKDKAYKNRYAIGAGAVTATGAIAGLCYWWSSSTAAAERKREERSRFIIREEITASQQRFRVIMKEESEALEVRMGTLHSKVDQGRAVGGYTTAMSDPPVWNISLKDYMMVFIICVLLIYIRAFVSGD